jgi:hypothetical protein
MILLCYIALAYIELSLQYPVVQVFKVRGGGCPYTASFLAESNFLKRVKYGESWRKMETMNWEVMKYADQIYQFDDPDLYFVNHMSAYEHSNRKAHGYAVSENKTKDFSLTAMNGECTTSSKSFETTNKLNIVAAIPFFGGRPPNVTESLQVQSLGQGNSLVSRLYSLLSTINY